MTLSPAPRLWGYREILGAAAIGILGQVLAATGALLVIQSAGDLNLVEAREQLLRRPHLAVPLQLVAWLPVVAYIGFIVRFIYDQPVRTGFGWHRSPRSVFSYLRAGALLAVLSAALAIAIGDPDKTTPMMEIFEDRDALWLLALYGIVVAPCVEEGVFRGFLFAGIEGVHGPALALIVSTLVFALLHGGQYGWQWQQVSILVAVGGAFGIIRLRSGSARASALAHSAYNAVLIAGVVWADGALG